MTKKGRTIKEEGLLALLLRKEATAAIVPTGGDNAE